MIKKINLLKINQWLDTWNLASPNEKESAPPNHFFVGAVSLKTLRRFSDAHRRDIKERHQGSRKAGIQRSLESDRANRISRYINYGYPFSSDKSLSPNDANLNN